MDHTELELLLDKYGCCGIAEALAAICHEKAEHVRASYSDEALASVWTRNANVFDRASGKLSA